jgi:hypothetical protein
MLRSVAQSGSAPGLGPGGPRFESLYSDHIFATIFFATIIFRLAHTSLRGDFVCTMTPVQS